MTSFALEPIYGSLILAIAAVVVTTAVIFMVTPTTTDPKRRRWLIGLRMTAAAVLMLAMLRPTLVRTDSRPADAALIVAVDTSRSMTLPDGDGGDRWSSQVEAWQKLAEGLSGQDTTLSLRLLGYDASTRTLPSFGPDALSDVKPDGDQTDLQAAATAAIAAAQGQPIAGVVMMGDGNQTAPVTAGGVGRVIETLNSLGVPFWTVPIGPPRGEAMSRDVAVDALPENYQLFAGNQIEISFQLHSRGMSGTDLPVRLTWIAADGSRVETATRNVAVDQAIDVAAVVVPVTAPSPGTYQLEVSADVQDGELVVTNNVQIAFVDVREGGGRILYLFGNLDQEQSLIRRSLRRFPDLDLTYRWIPTDTVKSWPVDFRGFFEPGKFDIYVIGDLDADAIGDRQLEQLVETIGAGAGLVTLGGYQSYGPGGYATSPLADIIPVQMDASERRVVGSVNPPENQSDAPVSIRLTRNHPITDLGGGDPSQAWQQLPSLLGANLWQGPKIAPGVQVLLESERADPLLVVGQYGRGRTAALAFDSTWRWWRGGDSDAHRRFWRQLMLWLLSREESGDEIIIIQLLSRRFSSEQPPNFRAVADSPDLPMFAEIVSIKDDVIQTLDITTEASSESTESNDESAVLGTLPKLTPGIYRLRVGAKSSASPIKPAQVAFQVLDESRELAQPMADPVFLRQLADLTRDHGGGAYSADQIGELVNRILERRKQAETPVIEKLTLGDGPGTAWPLFILFATALSAEWFLRRRWGLA